MVLAAMLGAAGAEAQEAPAPVRVSGGVMAGLVVGRVEPVCPATARQADRSGAVVLRAIIGTNGRVVNLQVATGPEMLRAAALDAVRQWTWQPYLLNGVAVQVDTTVTASFQCGGSAERGAQEEIGPAVGADPPPPTLGKARIAGGVMAGQILTKVNPVYPADARLKGISGVVVMHAIIGRDGQIANLTVLSGPEELRQSATDAVSQWTYRP
jgi:TonB family protein